jgi:deazaflavin-dependent oxidoreductase (nitroreductase family)
MDTPPAVARAAATGAAKLLRTRWLVRAPIWAYRARLGVLFGSRLVMLEHTGRTSGRRRFVVLEVVGHPAPGTYLVVSGFGVRAQWFRNIQATPQVRLWTGSRKPAPAMASILTSSQTRAALAAYAAARPRTWATLKPALEHTLGAELTDLPMVALDLVRGPAAAEKA